MLKIGCVESGGTLGRVDRSSALLSRSGEQKTNNFHRASKMGGNFCFFSNFLNFGDVRGSFWAISEKKSGKTGLTLHGRPDSPCRSADYRQGLSPPVGRLPAEIS